MITKWRTDSFGAPTIKEVEIVRETEQSVFVLAQGLRGKEERRVAKRSEYFAYHDSWDAAKLYLLDIAEAGVLSARNVLQRANDKLGNVKGMKP